MISPEFKSAVSSNNLLRTRIMLKDSLIVDPTFQQFDEMLLYAKQMLPDILVAFDGDTLETNSVNWDKEQLNLELVLIVNNFSQERISHLKQVVSVVMSDEKQRILNKRTEQNIRINSENTRIRSKGSAFSTTFFQDKTRLRQEAINQLYSAGRTVGKIIQKVETQGKKWTPTDVEKMECAAIQILDSTRNYGDNR